MEIDGKEIERKLLTSNRQFTFDVDGLIKQESDKVEVVGYRYSTEVTRQKVNIKPVKAEMTLDIYKLDTPYVTGKVTAKSAKSVRLYVNRRRQETVKMAEDGTFNLLGVEILSVTDKVEVALLNEQGVEMLL
ncbi:immunoglobulin-like domain-containing protein [Enterococcus sp. AZ126]|uniref:immunoglobulin-like domain-containing protein n=1 Tax=Enterococcus sp. AZ126 TaxID=2774635 RepID=UPI003F2459B3